MPSILVQDGDISRWLPLAATCLVGRSAACLGRVANLGCPAHWLELRWRGDGWSWRPLAGGERTRGAGAVLPDGWRRMDMAGGKGTRISHDCGVSVELIEGGDPAPFVWDLLADAALSEQELDEVVEILGGELRAVGPDGAPAARLTDGQCWLHRRPSGELRALRAHLPMPMHKTEQPTLDLSVGGVTATLELRESRLTLRRGRAQVEVKAACVRALAVFALARNEAIGRGEAGGPSASSEGWITAAEAYQAWVRMGGPASSPVDAVAWERGRLRRLLHGAGVASLDLLFEQRKEGPYVRTRLGLAVEHAELLP
jgi:hypothetical protein